MGEKSHKSCGTVPSGALATKGTLNHFNAQVIPEKGSIKMSEVEKWTSIPFKVPWVIPIVEPRLEIPRFDGMALRL